MSLEVSNESGGLYAMRQMLRRWLGEHGAGFEETEDVIMACNEACENAVEHGYDFGNDLFDVELAHDDGEITVCVRDRGSWLEPRATADRGRGLPLMRQMMDAVDVQSGGGGTTVLMRRRLAASAPPVSRAAAPPAPSRPCSLTSRSLAIVWRRMRETCIWLMPTTAPISACVMSSSKRIRRIARERGETARQQPIELGARLGALDLRVLGAKRVLERDRIAGLALRRMQRQRAARAAGLHRLEDLLVVDADRGRELARRRARDRVAVRGSASAPSTRSVSSCMPRGGLTIHVRSRKWRLSSPAIVGTANELNALPRPGS